MRGGVWFGGVYFPCGQSHFSDDKGVVCVTVCTEETSSAKDATQVCTPGDDKVEVVPVSRLGLSLGDFVVFFELEVGVCQT